MTTIRRILLAVTALVVLGGIGVAVTLHAVYGGGAPYPDVTGEPIVPGSALEAVVTSDQAIGNVAVSADGRVFYTIHPESNPVGPRLYEWRDGKAVPFPDAARQVSLFAAPLGLCIDSRNRLWVIDPAEHGTRGARLVALDLATGEVVEEHRFSEDVAPLGSFLQDLRTDPAAETVFIADASFWRREPAIVVYDVKTGTARRVLQGHESVRFQNWLVRTPIKDMRFFGGILELKTGIDGIAVSPDGTWVYWAAMNHDTLYRVRAADLRDPSLDPATLAARVEAVGRKPLSDGISTDADGGVLVTDVEHGAVVRIVPGGARETLVKDPKVRWADAVSHGPDGWVYLADSAIPHLLLQSRAHVAENGPYTIWRFRPPQGGVPGQ
jgi:sugar lactone lactonase YvrE